jgi:hypothetical protein
VGDERRTDVRVIAPALNSRLCHWLSDEDGSSDSMKNGSAFRTGRRAGGARRAALVTRSMAPACRRIEANA